MRRFLTVPATVTLLLLLGCDVPGSEPDDSVPKDPSPPSSPSNQTPASPVGTVRPFPTEPVERELAGAEAHGYEIELNAGDYLHAVIDQRGIDVEVRVLDPHGETVLTLDTATPHGGTRGPEELHYVAERSGVHVVLVRPWDPRKPGRYEIRRVHQRRAAPEDRLRAEAARLFSEAQSLWLGSDDEIERAIELLHRSRKLWQRLGENRRRALAEYSLGVAHLKLEQRRDAEPWLESAIPDLESAGEHWFTATALHELAHSRFELGETSRVLDLYSQALPLREQAGDVYGEALTLHNLGYVYHALGRFREALDHYERALVLYAQLESHQQRAQTLHNRGRLLARLGRSAEAQMDLEAALSLRRDLGRLGDLAATLDALGRLHAQQDNTSGALSYLERARQLREKVEDREGVAITWRSLGTIHRQRGDLAAAHSAYQRSFQLLETLDEPRQLARTQRDMGVLELERSQSKEALVLLQAALDHFRTARDVHGEMDGLAGLARAYRQLDRLEEARKQSQKVLRHLEMLETEPETYTLRSSYLATQQKHCDFHVSLLMEAGDASGAFEASERCRARALLTLLRDTGAERYLDADPIDVERELELSRTIRGLETHRLELLELEAAASPERIANLEREVRRLLAERTRLRARLSVRDPRRTSLTKPPVRTLDEIHEMLDRSQALLLDYRLGAPRSFVWAVTGDQLRTYVLPSREEIESLVRQAHDLLSTGHRRSAEGRIRQLLGDLGSILLAPASDLLDETRTVVIVGDGLLPLVPFAALPLAGRPLVDTHELRHVPSMSTLAVLEERSPSGFPAGLLAVLADPVFSRDDPRIHPEPGEPARVATVDSASTVRGARLTRLVHSGREAERIVRRVPASQRFSATGFDARRDLVTGGRLDGFKILHFATHARIDSEQPDLSHLVFSRWTRTGEPVDGLLFSHELFGLELPADLVVLSACDTALGRQVRGEGLVGLTQGFFHAGASRVLASLWPVEDEATTELMDRFYEHLLDEGAPPALALRRAQLDIKKEPRWEAPYFWAGFHLQGR